MTFKSSWIVYSVTFDLSTGWLSCWWSMYWMIFNLGECSILTNSWAKWFVWLAWKLIDFFVHKTWSHNFDIGCHISSSAHLYGTVLTLIPFKPWKGTPTMVTPSISKFQLIPQSGLPCRHDNISILFYANNWLNLNQICIKDGTEICFNISP